jgi:hypothetical protein
MHIPVLHLTLNYIVHCPPAHAPVITFGGKAGLP